MLPQCHIDLEEKPGVYISNHQETQALELVKVISGSAAHMLQRTRSTAPSIFIKEKSDQKYHDTQNNRENKCHGFAFGLFEML
jgi:hypothetical protein